MCTSFASPIQLAMQLWITTKSQFLTSTFQLFHTSSEWMNPLRSEQTTDITKTSFKCKTPAHKEKVKVCHEWIRHVLLQILQCVNFFSRMQSMVARSLRAHSFRTLFRRLCLICKLNKLKHYEFLLKNIAQYCEIHVIRDFWRIIISQKTADNLLKKNA